ncbi:MAG: hypothetical protein FJ218_09565 [Ignavibacteria bacterium]|nr:hypothetical protein [Ignavibacteria bacterium]
MNGKTKKSSTRFLCVVHLLEMVKKHSIMDEEKYEIHFDGRNYHSGTYFYRLTVTQQGMLRYTETKKLLLMK